MSDAADVPGWLEPEGAATAPLPCPTTLRWQPLRLGLVDLFYYDDEQFWFHDGRLLLRGNNGTGKSKVLALTLPFLLDGSVHPRRVEPDADPKKRMEWNLLLGGAHPHTERTGYSWVEFGRVDQDGTEHFTTLGIGLKAAAGRGLVKTWYVVTSRRIGDLRLVDDHQVVLTQERLRDELTTTGTGQVLTTQAAYRRLVDETLFGLGEERYAALVDLLVQLRQPQLSKKPDEKALSSALTEALPPLDQAVVTDVAESFRSLEEERTAIAEAKDTLGAAQGFLKHYRRYAEVAARRHTSAVREANSTYEWAGRNLREAETALVEAGAAADRVASAKAEVEEEHSRLHGQDQALRASPEMRSAEQLERAGKDATDLARRSSTAATEAEAAGRIADRETSLAEAAARRRQDAVDQETERATHAARSAEQAGLSGEHPALAADEAAARRAITRRREQVTHVHGLADAAQRAREHAARRRAALDTAEAAAATRAEDVAAGESAVEAAVLTHRDGVRDHLAGLRVLVVADDLDDLAARAEEWARSQSGQSPARAAVDAALSTALHRISRQRAAAEQALDQVGEEATLVAAEIDDLVAGRDPEPPAVPGRSALRSELVGAPLWRLTDFATSCAQADRAGLEAALQSAGLLDAWVFPDGTLETDGDVVLSPYGPPVESSLAAVLVAAVGPDEVVSAETVQAVIGRLGLGEAAGAAWWIDATGRWGAGPARGRWHKHRAEFIGAGARETSRRERLLVLRQRQAELTARLAAVRDEIRAADELAGRAGEESTAYPRHTEDAVLTQHAAVAAARRELERAHVAVVEATTRWEDAVRQADDATSQLDDEAALLALPTTLADLEVVRLSLTDYGQALSELRAAGRALVDATLARDQAEQRSEEARTTRQRRDQEAVDLRGLAARSRARFEELAATVGASVADLQARLGEVERALEVAAASISRLAQDQLTAAGAVGTLQQKVQDLELRRDETAAGREREVAALRVFASTGLLRVAVPDLTVPDPGLAEEWNVTSALTLSRTAEQHLDGTDAGDDAWSRSQQRVSSASTELASQMSRHGHTGYLEQRGDVLVARVRYLGADLDIDRLAVRLAQDVEDRERLLSAREREILENHLVNEVAGHLHELLLATEVQIGAMNRELAERRTSTGMQLRVRWRERGEGPVGLATARRLMLRSDATWTASDRAAIGDFLQAQIGEIRQADPTGGWQEHLEQALDYRRWHSFTVERLQHGQWRSASGPASGGEKALAVSIPLFAAASAHYNSAGPLAPRLILLDEAFAGVDDDSRAKSLGLLATFDLDVVMTSEREWGCYPQVPGLAIAQLSRVEGIDAVGVTRWRWDGRRRERSGDVEDGARAGATRAPQAVDSSLFE